MLLQVFNPPIFPKTPWFKENPFWGGIGGFIALLLTGVGFAVSGHQFLGRLLIVLAWPWAAFTLWLTINGLNNIKGWRIAARIAMLIAVALLGWSVDRFIVRSQPAVIVAPRTVKFDGSIPRENYPLTVQNVSDSDQYTIRLKMRMPLHSSFEDFSFNIPQESRKPIIEGSVLADIAFIACSDKDARPLMIALIYRMEPHTSRQISITHNLEFPTDVQTEIAYTDIPQPRTDDPGKMVAGFVVDEHMICKAAFSFGVGQDTNPRPLDIYNRGKR